MTSAKILHTGTSERNFLLLDSDNKLNAARVQSGRLFVLTHGRSSPSLEIFLVSKRERTLYRRNLAPFCMRSAVLVVCVEHSKSLETIEKLSRVDKLSLA